MKIFGVLAYIAAITLLVILSSHISTPSVSPSSLRATGTAALGPFHPPLRALFPEHLGDGLNCALIYENRDEAEMIASIPFPGTYGLPNGEIGIEYLVLDPDHEGSCVGAPEVQMIITSEEGETTVSVFEFDGEFMTAFSLANPNHAPGYQRVESRPSRGNESDYLWDASGYHVTLTTDLDLDSANRMASGLRW